MTRASTRTHAPGGSTSPAPATSSPLVFPTSSPCGSSASTSWSASAPEPRPARTDTAACGSCACWKSSSDHSMAEQAISGHRAVQTPLQPLPSLKRLLHVEGPRPGELEGAVQNLHRTLDAVARDHAGDLDRRGGDHVDVHALLGEHAEDLRRDARVRAHACADDRDLAHLLVGVKIGEGPAGERL